MRLIVAVVVVLAGACGGSSLGDGDGDGGSDGTDAGDLAASGEYYSLRVWNRGADRTSDPAIVFVPGTPVVLEHTGLNVTIDGAERNAGDYWIIAARPETPNRVVPWNLETGRRPHDGVEVHWNEPSGPAPRQIENFTAQSA